MAHGDSPEKGKRTSIIAGVIFIVAGLVTLYFGLISIDKANEIEKWPTVKGTVTYAKARMQKEPEGGGTSSFIADIKYAYEVNGARYNGDTVSLGQYGSSNRKHVRDELKKYPAGREVTVYYDPHNPGDAVLEPGWGWINAIPLVTGLGISAFGGFIVRKGNRG